MTNRKACIISILIHAFIFAFMFSNWLKWPTAQVDLMNPQPVEVETFSEKSQSPNPLNDSLKIDEPQLDEIVKQPPPTVEELKPLDPVIPQPTVPDDILPNTDEPSEPEPLPIPEPKTIEEPNFSEPEPLPIPEPKIIEKPKPIIKEKKQEKTEKNVTIKKVEKPKPLDALSILKNLQQTAKSNGNSKDAPIIADNGQGGELSDHLTASELDRVRRQIESVWNVPGAIQNAHKITVRVKIVVNQDRTVRSAKIVNSEQMNDPTFRTMAESTLRAVNHFKERPLLLSPEKYTIWKEITINFDPRDLL